MEISQVYKNAFTEVYTILDFLDEEDYYKIPTDILDVIESNRNVDYKYEMNEDIDIFKQPMLPETKAILFNFYRDYWATTEQKDKIKKIQAKEMHTANKQKEMKYGSDVFGNKKEFIRGVNDEESMPVDEEKALVVEKEDHFFARIIKKIKSLFRRK